MSTSASAVLLCVAFVDYEKAFAPVQTQSNVDIIARIVIVDFQQGIPLQPNYLSGGGAAQQFTMQVHM